MKLLFAILFILICIGCSNKYNNLDIILLDISPSRTEKANDISIQSAIWADSVPGTKKVICFIGATADQSVLEIEYPTILDLESAKKLVSIRESAEDSLKSVVKRLIGSQKNKSNIIESAIKVVKKYRSLNKNFKQIRLIIYSDGVVEEKGLDLNKHVFERFPESYTFDISVLKAIEIQIRTFTNSTDFTTFSNRIDFNKIEAFWQDFAVKSKAKLSYIGSSYYFK